MPSLGELFVTVGAKIDGFEKQMGTVSKRLEAVDKEAQKSFGGFQRMGDQLSSFGQGMSMAVTLPLVGFGAAAVSAFGDLDALKRGLIAVTGNAEEAGRQFEALKEVAKLPGLGLEEAVQGAVRMQALGFSFEQSKEIMLKFGNAIATVGGTREDLDETIRQLTQLGARGQVTADNLKPIIERVPQVAAIIKEKFGPEALGNPGVVFKQMGVDSQQFIQTVLTELGKLPPVTGGIKNEFENFKDSVKIALSQAGEALAPFATRMLQIGSEILGVIQTLAAWFLKLPEPVQTAAVGILAFAAAMGPVTMLIGNLVSTGAQIGKFIGMAGEGFKMLAPWATQAGAAISSAWASLQAFVAAPGILAGLGSAILPVTAAVLAFAAAAYFVYQNWNEIVGVLKGIWADLGNAFGAVGRFLLGVIEAVFGSRVAQFIVGIWNGIAGFFANIWGNITAIFNGALKGILGAAKAAAEAIGATNTAAALQAWIDKLNGVKVATAEVAVKTATLSQELPKLSLATGGAAAAHEKAADAGTRHAASLKNVSAELSALVQQGAAARDAIDWSSQLEKLQAGIDSTRESVEDLTKALPGISAGLDEVLQTSAKSADKLGEAFKTLGVQTSDALRQKRDAALDSYQAIRDSGIATADEILRAEKAALEEEIRYRRATGQEITDDMQRRMEQLERITGDGHSRQKTQWAGFAQQVSTVITNFAQDISKSLWDGNLSWGEKGKKLLKDLGQAVTSMFIEPATAAIADFVKNTIEGLLSGSLGKLGGLLGDLGSKIGGIFGGGGGGGAVGAAGGAAGSAGGAAGSVGSAVGSGVMGTIGALASLGTLVSGVIGNFQNARQEDTLNAIEWNTRKSSLHLQDILVGFCIPYLPALSGIHDRLRELREIGIGVFNRDNEPLLITAGAGGGGNTFNFDMRDSVYGREALAREIMTDVVDILKNAGYQL